MMTMTNDYYALLKPRSYILTQIKLIRGVVANAYMDSAFSTSRVIKYKSSRALIHMAKAVNNEEANYLIQLNNSVYTQPDVFIDAVIDFLDTLVAFNNLNCILAFINYYVLEEFDFDNTTKKDIKPHYLVKHIVA